MAVPRNTGMLLQLATKAVASVERHRKVIDTVGWLAFAAICADYAGILNLPPLLAFPLWAGVIASILRWAVWEGILKERVVTALNAERSSADPDN